MSHFFAAYNDKTVGKLWFLWLKRIQHTKKKIMGEIIPYFNNIPDVNNYDKNIDNKDIEKLTYC